MWHEELEEKLDVEEVEEEGPLIPSPSVTFGGSTWESVMLSYNMPECDTCQNQEVLGNFTSTKVLVPWRGGRGHRWFWCGMASYGMVLYVLVWYGLVWYDVV